MIFAFDLEPREFYSLAMLDPPTDRRLYKIAHSRRSETFNLRPPMLTISIFFDVPGFAHQRQYAGRAGHNISVRTASPASVLCLAQSL
jgi:hypothetical protein